MQIQMTNLIVALWRAALHTSAGEEKEGRVTRVTPMLRSNLKVVKLARDVLFSRGVPLHSWAEQVAP